MECVFPGSFDPITVGHLAMIQRLQKRFDRVVVAILYNPNKMGRFSLEDRIGLIQKACVGLEGIHIAHFDGLLVDFMKQYPSAIVVRGMRNALDFQAESQMAQINRELNSAVETLFLMTAPEHAHISSSAVREIASFGGDLSSFVPHSILEDVIALFSPLNH